MNGKHSRYSPQHVAEFREETLRYLEKTPLEYRRQNGQYFTPKSVRDALLAHLPRTDKKIRILDPACGSGEFLLSALERYPRAAVEGWEIDEELVKIAKALLPSRKVSSKDSLRETQFEPYDVIIGNPPYFEFSPDKTLRNAYGALLNGRPNIFGLFIKLGLDLLKEGGFLAYVVPPSMNNGAYFAKVRDYIIKHSNIEFLEIIRDTALFPEALQMVMLLILKKGKNRGHHIFRHRGISIFTENVDFLKRSFANTVSLKELGYRVRTGRLVWNQHKEELTHDPVGALPLLWAHNIAPEGLRFPMIQKKPQYVKMDLCDEGPAILVNRITGAASKAKLRAAMIPVGMRFIAENHCNVIFPPSGSTPGAHELGGGPAKRGLALDEIYEQLNAPENDYLAGHPTHYGKNTQVFLKYFSTELENLFPISLK